MISPDVLPAFGGIVTALPQIALVSWVALLVVGLRRETLWKPVPISFLAHRRNRRRAAAEIFPELTPVQFNRDEDPANDNLLDRGWAGQARRQ